MDNKKLLILAGAGLILLMMNNKKQIANGTLSTANYGISSLSQALGNWLSGNKPASQPYGGKTPTAQGAANAANAANRDSNPDLNGSVSDYVSNDGIALNPPGFNSAYDFTKENWY